MKNIIITGRFNPTFKALDFYAVCNGESYYIFTRKYRTALFNYFRNGVPIRKLFDFSRAHGNEVVINTLVQLKGALKYIEKENGLQIFSGKHDVSRSYRRREKYDCDFAA